MSRPLLDSPPPPFELYTPSAASAIDGLLDELRAFRGRELYADGRRPSFRVAKDSFFDADEHDAYAYHLLSRCPRTGELVATIRFMPIEAAPCSQVEAILGPPRTEQFLSGMDAHRGCVAEVARWIVRRDHQGKGLGLWLFAGAFALASTLGFEYFWSAAGVRDGQSVRAMRLGFRPVPEVAVMSSERYADEIRLLYAEIARPSEFFAPLVERMMPLVRTLAEPPAAPSADYKVLTTAARRLKASSVSRVKLLA